VPERAEPVLAVALKLTVPLPVPFAPLVTVIQLVWLTAVHAHPAVVATANVESPPPAGIERPISVTL
jgi:hypothetical protein